MGLLENIRNGKYDASLDRIAEAVRERKGERIYQLKPGDKVKFGPNTRPTYLADVPATIIEWRRSRVLVQIDATTHYAGRFLRGGGRILAHPPSLIPLTQEVKKND